MATSINTQNGLTDSQIIFLYKEYGFPAPDVNWVRKNLPTTEGGLKNVLQSERNKIISKSNTANTNTQPNSQPQQVRRFYRMPGTNDLYDADTNTRIGVQDWNNNWSGKQGVMEVKPVTLYSQNGQPAVVGSNSTFASNLFSQGWSINKPSQPTENKNNQQSNNQNANADAGNIEDEILEPFMEGQYSLIKFTDDPNGSDPGDANTVWLINNDNKTIRPILNEQAFLDLTGKNISDMASYIKVRPVNDIMDGGILAGYNLLSDPKYTIKEGGEMEDYQDETSGLVSRYGKAANDEIEFDAANFLDGFINLLKNSGEISEETINEIKSDENNLAIYLSAIAYGGYSLNDIYKDIRRKELVNQGQEKYENYKVIDSQKSKKEFEKSNEYRVSNTDPLLIVPDFVGTLDTSMTQWDIFNMPDDVFKTLVPLLDVNSDEFKKEMEKVQSAFHDILIKQFEATTEQQKSQADYDYNRLKEQLEKYYGLKLGDNANQAWDQLNQIISGHSQANLSNTGLEREVMDRYLKSVRKSDDIIRYNEMSEEEQNMIKKFREYATPEEIQALVDEDKAKGLPKEEWRAVKYGLVPSDEVLSTFSVENLKKKYPDVSEEELTRYRNSILDQNGNFRSSLYSTLQGNIDNTQANKRLYQQSQVLQENLDKSERVAREYQSPLSGVEFENYKDIKQETPPYNKPTETTNNLNKPIDTGFDNSYNSSSNKPVTSVNTNTNANVTTTTTPKKNYQLQNVLTGAIFNVKKDDYENFENSVYNRDKAAGNWKKI